MIELDLTETANYETPRNNQLLSECALVFSSFLGDIVITKHNISAGIIKEGYPIGSNEVLEAMQEHTSEKTANHIIPSNVLINSTEILAWHCKSEIRNMWFRISKPLKLKVYWPSLIFAVNKKRKSLYIYATATNARPHADTKLYRAPVMNTDKNGSVCLGSAKLPDELSINTINEIQDCLFNSYFTHLNAMTEKKGCMFSEDALHIRFWRKKQKLKTKVKAKDLLAFKTLSQTLKVIS